MPGSSSRGIILLTRYFIHLASSSLRAADPFRLSQVGIQFIQVGNDREAEKFLDELDKDLVNQMTSTHGRVMPSRSLFTHGSHRFHATGYSGHGQVQRTRSQRACSGQGTDWRIQS